MVVKTAMGLADGGGRARDAMMRMDSGGAPSPEDELHQLIRHCRFKGIDTPSARAVYIP